MPSEFGITACALDAQNDADNNPPELEPNAAEFGPSDATFRVPGRHGWGIQAGKNRASLSRQLTRESWNALAAGTTKGGERNYDGRQEQFGKDTSPIVRDLRASGELIIDLDAPAE